MGRKVIFLFIFINLLFFHGDGYAAEKSIEIFHVGENQVVEKILNTEMISNQLTSYLYSIDKVVPQLNPLQNAEMLIKVPLIKNVYLNNSFFQAEISEIVLVFPKEEEPFILLFDEEQRAMFFYLKLNLADFYLNHLLKISI